MGIFDLNKPGRMEPGKPVIAGHKSHVYDFDFNPFHEHIIATASDDTTVKVFGIPTEGVTETINEALVECSGHGRKATLVKFHPTCQNLLASTSADMTVKLWDVETGANINTLTDHENLIQDIQWKQTGNMYATSSKDKTVRLVDPRDNAVAQSIPMCHEGAKSVKLSFLGKHEKLLTVGFTKQSHRQMKVWDPRNLEKPLKLEKIDQAAGVIIPYFDEDTNVLYLAGKGDGNVRYYECVSESHVLFKLSEYRSTVATKGICFLPKLGCNVMKCETVRALKLTSNCVEPLSFVVPRKSDSFQEDLFPPTNAGQSTLGLEEWMDGVDRPLAKVSLDPAQGGAAVSQDTAPVVKVKTRSQLAQELDAATAELEATKAYVEVLIKALTDADVPVPPKA